MDPLAEKFPARSPYEYCFNNPLKYVDPDGRSSSPIYDTDGGFLGTDNKGLEGKPIIMKKSDFKQGMKSEDANKKDLAPKGGNQYKDAISGDDNYSKFYNHYNNIIPNLEAYPQTIYSDTSFYGNTMGGQLGPGESWSVTNIAKSGVEVWDDVTYLNKNKTYEVESSNLSVKKIDGNRTIKITSGIRYEEKSTSSKLIDIVNSIFDAIDTNKTYETNSIKVIKDKQQYSGSSLSPYIKK